MAVKPPGAMRIALAAVCAISLGAAMALAPHAQSASRAQAAAPTAPTATPSLRQLAAGAVKLAALEAWAPETARLRLRADPSNTARVLRLLAPLTRLGVLGKSADGTWLQVRTAAGERGWVMGGLVSFTPPKPAAQPGSASLDLVALGLRGLGPQTLSWMRNAARTGVSLDAFAVAGDIDASWLRALAPSSRDFGAFGDLEDALRDFQPGFDAPHPFAQPGMSARALLGSDATCAAGRRIDCALRARPAFVFLALAPDRSDMARAPELAAENFERDARAVISATRAGGALPILLLEGSALAARDSTLTRAQINDILLRTALATGSGALDLRPALDALDDRGVTPDGARYTTPVDANASGFTNEALHYGSVLRKLALLQTLSALRFARMELGL